MPLRFHLLFVVWMWFPFLVGVVGANWARKLHRLCHSPASLCSTITMPHPVFAVPISVGPDELYDQRDVLRFTGFWCECSLINVCSFVHPLSSICIWKSLLIWAWYYKTWFWANKILIESITFCLIIIFCPRTVIKAHVTWIRLHCMWFDCETYLPFTSCILMLMKLTVLHSLCIES